MTLEPNVLFSGRIPTSTTLYVPVPIRDGKIGAQIGWPDAVSSATITLELGSTPAAATAAGTAYQWTTESGVSITGPAAIAAGSVTVNVENVRQKQARFKIVTAAVTYLDIWDGLA
ncbi:MAG: hypothetical protein ACM358_11860 [Gemmatimonadota bacterium]